MKLICQHIPRILPILFATASLSAATDQALVELLVRRGVISAQEAESLEVSTDSPIDAHLLDLLLKNGALSAEDVAQLRPEQDAASSPPSIRARRSAESTSSTRFQVQAKEPTTRELTFSGRIQAQGDFIDTNYAAGPDPDREANLFIRRLYFGASADLTETLSGFINAKFDDGTNGVAEVEAATIQWDFTDAHALVAGYRKVPFSYEETTSSASLKAVERSIATRYFVDQLAYASRFTGLYLEGDYSSGLYFNTALTNPEQGTVNGSAEANTVAAWGQVGWKGRFGGLPWDLGFSSGRLEDVRQNGLTDWVWGVHAVTELNNLELTLEYLSGRLEEAKAGRNANPFGLILQGAWKVTPAFELVGRFSSLDTDRGVGADLGTVFRRAPESGDALYDEAQAYYLGGNWYIRDEALKLTAGYEWARFDKNLTGDQGDAEAAGFRTRLQFLY